MVILFEVYFKFKMEDFEFKLN